MLVLVGRKKCANEDRGFVRHLAQRVARQVRTRIFRQRTCCGGGPAAQVDAFDSHSLQSNRLARRIGTEGRDLLAVFEQFPQAGVKVLSRPPRYGVVAWKRTLLLGHLAWGVETDNARESGFRNPLRGIRHLLVDCNWLYCRHLSRSLSLRI